MAYGSPYGTVMIRDAKSGNTKTIAGHKTFGDTWSFSMPPLAWSPDGVTLASGHFDNRVLLWNLGAGDVLRPVYNHITSTVSMAWSRDGKTLAAGSTDRVIRLWKSPSGEMIRDLQHGGWISAVAFAPDGNTIATGTFYDSLMLFDAKTGKPIKEFLKDKDTEKKEARFRAQYRTIIALGWFPDGKQLMSAGWDGTVRFWNVADGKAVRIIDRTEAGLPFGELRAAGLSADGKYVAAAGVNGICRVWEAATAKLLATFNLGDGPRSMAWSPDHKTLAIGSNDGTIRFFQPGSEKAPRTIKAPVAHSIESISWSPDSKNVAAVTANGFALFDVDNGQLRRQFVPLANPQGLALTPQGHYRGTPRIEEEIVYVVQTDQGQKTLSAQEFARKYQWENDPQRVLWK